MESDRKELSHAQLIQNFNSMVICCIECGGTNLTKNGEGI
jgi:hypothetical protein